MGRGRTGRIAGDTACDTGRRRSGNHLPGAELIVASWQSEDRLSAGAIHSITQEECSVENIHDLRMASLKASYAPKRAIE